MAINHFSQSLRFKVTILVIAVELLIFSGVGVFYTHRFSQEIDQAIIARLSIPGLLMSRGELSFDAVSDKRTMEGLLREPYIEGIVIGLDRRIYFSSNSEQINTTLEEIDGLRLPDPELPTVFVETPDLVTPFQDKSGTYLVSLSPIQPEGKLTGYLYLKVGTQISEAEKRNIAILFAAGSIATIVLTAAILIWLLNLTVIGRLNSLVEIFRRFALGEYEARAQPFEKKDEIATLMRGFNELAHRLEETLANLRMSQQRLDNIVTNSPGAIYRCLNDEHWTMDFISAGITRISGYAAEEFLQNRVRSYASIIHPEDRQRVSNAVAHGLERQKRYEMEYRLVAANSRLRWVHEQGQGVYNSDGQLLYLDGVIFDITVQREAEEALHISSERLHLATRVAKIGIWDWDISNNELLWDNSMYQLYGIKAEDFGGAYDAWARTVHPEDREYTDGEIQAALRGEREYTAEFRIVRPDGAIRYIKAESKTFLEQDGSPLRMIGTNIDITERKQYEKQLQHYKDDLEETVQQRTEELRLARDAAEAANKAKSVFLANMSHELRTPLNAILGFSQMMQQEPELTATQRDDIEIINNSGMHLLKLINDILEIAKIEAGKLQLEISTFDLHALVDEVSSMMKIRAQQKGLQLNLDQSLEFPHYIKGDEARLRQILINLTSNAVKFTEQGAVTLHLGVQDKAHHHLLIEVEDNGPGISEADQQRLFRPFVQLPLGETQGGSGLGLTIINQFVQMMGGSITIESKLGEGSLFRIELPLEMPDEQEVLHLYDNHSAEVIGLEPGQPIYRILVAEDQHDNQILLVRLMTFLSLKVKVAENGEECVRLFKEWKPDLILMDWRMPVLDGAEAAQQIRQLPDGDKVKIVAVTASVFKEQQEELHAVGMDGIVRKPYRFNEIYTTLAEQLGLRYLYKEPTSRQPLPELDVERVNALPEELRRQLREAVERLETKAINSAIQQVRDHDADLANNLLTISEGFNYQILLDALNERG